METLARTIRLGLPNALRPLLGLLAFPLLSHWYSPAEFGLLAMFAAAVALAGSAVHLGYDSALATASDDEARQLYAEGLRWSVGLSAGVGGGSAVALLLLDEPVWLALALALAVLAFGGSRLAQSFSLRSQRVDRVASARLVHVVSEPLAQFALVGLIGLGGGVVAGSVTSGGLTLGHAIAWLLGAAVLLLPDLRSGQLRVVRASKQVRTRFAHFPRFATPAALLNRLSTHGAMIAFGLAYGASELALLALAQRTFASPAFVVSETLGQVYWTAVSEAPASAERAFSRFLALSLLAQVAVFALAFFLVLPILLSLLDDSWLLLEDSVLPFGCLFFVQAVVVPVSSTLNLMGLPRWQLAWDVLRVGAVTTAFAFSFFAGLEFLAAVKLYLGVMIACYGILLALGYISVRQRNPEASLDRSD